MAGRGVHPGQLFRSLDGLTLAAKQVVIAGSPAHLTASIGIVDRARQELYRLLADADTAHRHPHRTDADPSGRRLTCRVRRGGPVRCNASASAIEDRTCSVAAVTPVLRHDADLLRQRRTAPRPRLHDDRRRRPHPLAPPARRRRQVPHRHRRARPEDPAGGRRRRALARRSSPTGSPRASPRRGSALEHRQRRLHPHHRTAPLRARVAELLQRCYDAGDIELDLYRGKYCVRCEAYYTDDELLPGGLCPIHKLPVEEFEEENYFFRLSRFERPPARLVRRPPRCDRARVPRQRGARPDPLRAARLLRQPHQPRRGASRCRGTRSTSPTCGSTRSPTTSPRSASAPTTQQFEHWWPVDVPPHRQGHHPPPLRLLAGDADVGRHRACRAGYAVGGWLLVGGEKMSKTTGNVVKPLDLVDTVGVDGFRYYVLADTAVRQRRRLHLRGPGRPLQRRPRQQPRQPRRRASPPSSSASAAASARRRRPAARSPTPPPRRSRGDRRGVGRRRAEPRPRRRRGR